MRKDLVCLLVAFFLLTNLAQAGVVASLNKIDGKANQKSVNEPIYQSEEVDKPAVLQNAETVLKELGEVVECDSEGDVRIESVLHRSGKVTKIKVDVSKECKLSKPAEPIFRRLKFSPAGKGGKKVNQYGSYIIRKGTRTEVP